MVKFPEMAEHQNLQSDPCAPNISARVLSHITRLGLFGLIRTQFTGAVRNILFPVDIKSQLETKCLLHNFPKIIDKSAAENPTNKMRFDQPAVRSAKGLKHGRQKECYIT